MLKMTHLYKQYCCLTTNGYKAGLFFFFIIISFSLCAQIATNGDYRSRSNGSWTTPSTWQVRSAGTWTNTATPPGATNNVYIQNGHTITGSGNVRNLHINTGGLCTSESGILSIYGKIRAYTGTVVTGSTDAAFYTSQVSNSSTTTTLLDDGISSKIYLKGGTRNVTNAGEWGVRNMSLDLYVALDAGAIGTLLAPIFIHAMIIETGTINMDTNPLYLQAAGPASNGYLTVQANGTFMSANSGTSNTNCVITEYMSGSPTDRLNLYGKLILSGATPYVRIYSSIALYPGSTIEYAGNTNQNFLMSSYPSIVPLSTYMNLTLSGSGNKTPQSNLDIREDVTISGAAVFQMGSRTATVTGNWTSYGSNGLSEGTSTIDFDSTGAQTISTTGGEHFYIMKKSAAGTLSLNSDVNIVAGGNLNMSAGILDANTFALGGTTTSAFNMSNGTIKLAKLNTTLPEFLITSYNISGGTIELDGAGTQTLRGGRDYRNLTFSNSGTKGISSAINNITGTVRVANSVVLDVLNNTLGGAGTNLIMTGTSVYKTAGSSQVKPDATGTYSLGTGTTINFSNTITTGLESIRFINAASVTVNYYNVIVSGTSVGTASLATAISFQNGGSFTVKNAGIFKHTNTSGFSGLTTTAISSTNNPSIILETGSAVEYNGANQTISNQTITTPSNANYEGLILSGTGNKTAPAGNLSIRGDLTKTTGTVFIHNNGTVIMNGIAAQDYTSTYPGIVFNNFTNNNVVDLSINSEMSITKELAFGAGSKLNLQTGSEIILLSTASNTANAGKIPSTATISYVGSGKFTVHRYIPTASGPAPNHLKSWQFLATATTGTQTVNQAWQDTATAANQNRYMGYGTQITSNINPLPAMFDVYTVAGPTMKTYNNSTDTWTGIANTTTLPIYNKKGYMVFVRGNRSVITSGGTPVPTILRTSGRIFDGVSNIPAATAVAANKFESIGNPFASAIDFSNDAAVIKSANVQKIFYVWDPKLGGGYGFGAYQTFTKGIGADNNYYVSPGGGSYGSAGSANNFIQSGQAFFVHTVGGTGTVSFTEDAKVSSNSLSFRPSPVNVIPQLRNNLSVVINNEAVLIDGALDQFDRSFSNAIDGLDAVKIGNTGESISIKQQDKQLSVERKAIPAHADTIFYSLNGMRVQQYEFEFTTSGISNLGLEAFLEDNYLHTQTMINLSMPVRIRFDIANIPGSYSPDRFRVIFRLKNSCAEMDGRFL